MGTDLERNEKTLEFQNSSNALEVSLREVSFLEKTYLKGVSWIV